MSPRPGLILQHAPTGPVGRLGTWASARSIAFDVHHSWESVPDLEATDYAFVASLGAAASANATDPAWVPVEIEFLRRCVQADVPVLGLCWGGQALARALGATVGPAPVDEKGWLPIDSVDDAIPAGPWLHYHTEIFTIPDGATELARSPAGPSAFRVGPHLGLQFHPEADMTVARGWAEKDPDQTVGSRAELSAAGERFDADAGALAEHLFDAWWASLGSAVSG